MTSPVQAFFNHWVEHDLPRRMALRETRPTPLAMVAALLEAAAREGIDEYALRVEVSDLFEHVVQAMIDVPEGKSGIAPYQQPVQERKLLTPAAAMQLAISYLDGFREAFKDDIDLAADLVLNQLAHQGFQLAPLPEMNEASGRLSRPIEGDDLERRRS